MKEIRSVLLLDLRLRPVDHRLNYNSSWENRRCDDFAIAFNLSSRSSTVNSDCSSSLSTGVLHWMNHRSRCDTSIVYLVHRLRLIMGTTDETLNRVETRRSDSFVYSPSPSEKQMWCNLIFWWWWLHTDDERAEEKKEREVSLPSLLFISTQFSLPSRFDEGRQPK